MKNKIFTTATDVAPPSVRQGTNFSSQSIPGQLFDGGEEQKNNDGDDGTYLKDMNMEHVKL